MERRSLIISILAVVLIFSSFCPAVNRLVPSQYTTIQSAINDCNDGDTVIIFPGTYTGSGNKNLDYGGRAITVRSINPDDPCTVAATIIDCQNSGRGFYFHSGESSSSVLSGLTIKNGKIEADWPIFFDVYGGGIFCEGASPAIENCQIVNNLVTAYVEYSEHVICGGGIACISGSYPTITNCNISDNSALGVLNIEGSTTAYGGGIYCDSTSSISVYNCEISDNTTRGGHWGSDASWITYSNSSYGGGICNAGTGSVVKNCLITNNRTVICQGESYEGQNHGNSQGSGIYCSTGTAVRNCTFAGNYTYTVPVFDGYMGEGGGIYGPATVTDCIVWDNSSGNQLSGVSSVSYSDIQDGWSGAGNLDADPCFVSAPDGDYYLSQIAAGQGLDSPCVDAGSDTAANLGMDEYTTRTDEVCDNGVVDMGYHYPIDSSLIVPGSPDIDENLSVDAVDFSILADDWRQSGADLAGDLTKDLYVDFNDLLIFADAWLDCFVGSAGGPAPINGATDVDPNVVPAWIAGSGAIEHDVYLGTDANAVAEAGHLSAEFMGTVTDANFDPCGLDPDTTYYWRIDEIGPACTAKGYIWNFTTAPAPPDGASNPSPADGAIDVGLTQDLSWTAGSGATSHDVYFGTANPPPFIGNQTGTVYDTGTMDVNTIYYWRIDEKNASGTTIGTVWSFTTVIVMPGQAFNPMPDDGDVNVSPSTVLSWTAGVLADRHDIYLGTDFNDVNDANVLSPEFKGNQSATIYYPYGLDVNTTYYWRIDEKNASGTTTGNIWSFTTRSGPEPIDPNLVGWWKFDEGSGTTVNDSAGNPSNGTVNGGANWVVGKINSALNFDGSNDDIIIPDNDDSLDMDNQITIAAWVKPNNFSNYYYVLVKRTTAFPGNYEFRLSQISGLLQLIHQTGASTYTTYTSTSALTTGAWQHVAITLKEGDSVNFYINGTLAGTLPQTEIFGIANNEPLRIGSRNGAYWFNGDLDDVRVYNRALSDTEVGQLYNEGMSP
ncbi:MAG: right-handed parallel beta-helix repeat-containing protein [Sedimentisphaerales bacterium]|nr:right-handed parallel beta-helix repeat-containing protein [Sedimentisphaerales bacterium]